MLSVALHLRRPAFDHSLCPLACADEHPEFKAELLRIEEEKAKKLSKTKHMFRLHRENEQANFECERSAATRTCEVCGLAEPQRKQAWRMTQSRECWCAHMLT